MEAIWNFEITITLFLQSLGSWLTVPMKAFTFLGQEEFFMLILPALYWCINPSLGIQVGALLMLSTSINGYFKMAMHGARPYWFNTAVKPGVFETSFGMPSGHAMNSMSIWGLIGSFLKSTRGKVLAGLVILFIGLSRIYLGVHFTSDVLVGWALGAVLLFVFIRWQRPVTAWAKKLSLAGQVVVSLISALALVAINTLVVALFGSWVVPETWVQNAALANPDELIAPYSVTGILTSAGTWFGLFAGLAWLNTRGVYSADGTVIKRALRYLVGVIGVTILYLGLGQIFPRNPDLISYTLRFIRYTLIGLWVSALAPMVFIRLGLADPLKKSASAETKGVSAPAPVS